FGPLPNDIRNRFVGNGTYNFPWAIKVTGTVTRNSGAPYNITTGKVNPVLGPLVTNARPVGLGFDSARGDGLFQTDIRTSKKFTFSEKKVGLEAYWEMYNVFNTKNYLRYNGNQSSTTFGKPSLAFDPFQGQVGVKMTF